jgi:undecaprenyl-diphosphatase
MQLWQALFLGVLQGFSELFPVSSLGHTILIPAILHWKLNEGAGDFLAFLVALHLATATALLIYFWREWRTVVLAYAGSFTRRTLVYDDASKFAWLLVAGTIVVGAFGLLFENRLRLLFEDPRFAWIVAVLLILNGGVMLLGDYMRRRSESLASRQSVLIGAVGSAGSRKVEGLNFVQGGAIGATQILALFPGISRSGVTIVAGLLAGLNYEGASRFSFMLATPVIGLAALLKVPDLFKPEARAILAITVPAALLAGVTAYLSVRFLMRYFETKRLAPFAYYCVVAGVVALVLVLTGV